MRNSSKSIVPPECWDEKGGRRWRNVFAKKDKAIDQGKDLDFGGSYWSYLFNYIGLNTIMIFISCIK